MSLPQRRFVYLVAERCKASRKIYSLRRFDMSRFFHPNPPPPPPPPPSDGFDMGRLPPPCMTFGPPRSEGLSAMKFLLLSGPGGARDKLIAADQMARSVIYDDDLRAIRAGPNLCSTPKRPISVPVGESLYVFDSDRATSIDKAFQVLIHSRRPEHEGLGCYKWSEDWSCQLMPPPPLDLLKGANVRAYTVVGGRSIWVSPAGLGTYAFDTKRRVWNKQGDWALPFSGLAHYVPEHKLWFGLSPVRFLCASDLSAAQASNKKPVLTNIWEDDIKLPKEWCPVFSNVLHLGSARFCITRLFSKLAYDDDGMTISNKKFALLTAVEVERCAEVDGGLRMVKHKSECYAISHYCPSLWFL